MKEQIIQLILARLEADREKLTREFQASSQEVGVRYAVVDDLLPLELAKRVHDNFPATEKMRLMDSFRERKFTSKSFEQFDPLMKDITFAFQDPRVVAAVEAITGIRNQVPDSSLYAGGLSAMKKGHFLGPHIDNSHDGARQNYRTLNLLYYVTPDWKLENGGNLELWDTRVKTNATIVSRFNRLAIMETNPWSWHSVSEVQAPGVRCCVSNYYFSPTSPTGAEYFNITAFSARPEQKLLRVLAWADGHLRQAVRRVIPSGLGRKDVYKEPKH